MHFNSETECSSQSYQEHDITKPGSQKIRLTHKERYGDPVHSNNNALSMFNFAISKRR